jgi:hypothetical protein
MNLLVSLYTMLTKLKSYLSKILEIWMKITLPIRFTVHFVLFSMTYVLTVMPLKVVYLFINDSKKFTDYKNSKKVTSNFIDTSEESKILNLRKPF